MSFLGHRLAPTGPGVNRAQGLVPAGLVPCPTAGQPSKGDAMRWPGAGLCQRNATPWRAAACLPPWGRQAFQACPIAGCSRPAAGSLRSMGGAGPGPARSARRAAAPPVGSHHSPFALYRCHFANCTRGVRGVKGALLAVITRSLRCAWAAASGLLRPVP